MKNSSVRSVLIGAVASGCALGLVLPPQASATVSDSDFKALKDLVTKQGQELQQLQKVHNRDQQLHQQDQQQIQQLQQQILQTKTVATNAAAKAEAASKIQPSYPAPNPAPEATHNFLVTGDAEVQFYKQAGQNSTFALADFAPIFLFRANNNVLFEAGFDTALGNDGGTSVDLSFAQLDYLYNDYVTLVAGDILLPLGTYNERAAGWLNKIPDDPLLHDMVDILPGSGIGAELRGSFPVGETGQMLTYAVYGVNGPSQQPGKPASIDNLAFGQNNGSDSPNLHSAPSGGGRIGWFYPWGFHRDIELGVSGQTGQWSNSGNRHWSAAVLDAAIHWGPFIEAKGEYVNTWVGTDSGTVHQNGMWVQASYKLAGLNTSSRIVNNLELVGRYGNVDNGYGTHIDRYTAGFVYYFTDTLLFEGDYEWLDYHGSNQTQNLGSYPSQLIFQLSYGF